jgi:general stress protein YciG
VGGFGRTCTPSSTLDSVHVSSKSPLPDPCCPSDNRVGGFGRTCTPSSTLDSVHVSSKSPLPDPCCPSDNRVGGFGRTCTPNGAAFPDEPERFVDEPMIGSIVGPLHLMALGADGPDGALPRNGPMEHMDQNLQDFPPSDATTKPRSRRGFAGMDPTQVRLLASRGGKAAHEQGTAHQFTPEEARAAGRKGGLASHRQRDDKA